MGPTSQDSEVRPDMRSFLLSAVVVAVYWVRLATGWATISDNGYDDLVVAISPDVTIFSILTILIYQTKDPSLDS